MISKTLIYSRPKESAIAKLSLISLMDIFTILVFFLMFNSGETQNIETAKVIQLPDSVAGKSPQSELTLFVSEHHVIVDHSEIAEVREIRKDPGASIEELKEVLLQNTENLGDLAQQQEKIGYSVTIMADKSVDYEILKSVMETCREQNYRNISLAVNRVESTSVPVVTDTQVMLGEGE